MGFLNFFKRKREPFQFQNRPHSMRMKNALEHAAEQPLSDFTYRLVVAMPEESFIFDVSLIMLDSLFTSWEKMGREKPRHAAYDFLQKVNNGKKCNDEMIKASALSFFDRDFTVAENSGKSHETAWNTLILDAELMGDRLEISRGTCRLDFPVGSIDLGDPMASIASMFGQDT